MFRKIALGVVVVLLVMGIGLFFWARAILSTDAVRSALAGQLTRAIGQPVSVESVSAGIYPRVTVTLKGISIGQPARITMASMDVGTNLMSLLSRRIEHAALHINQARLELPLPPLNIAGSTGAPRGSSSTAPVELVSIDEVVLKDIELVSRGRTLRGDIEVVPHGISAVTIRRIALTADTARIEGTGEISDMAGPVGTIDLKATSLDLDQLTVFASDFAEGSTTPRASSAVDLTVTLAADHATMAGVALDAVSGRAHLKGDALNVDPMKFNLFGGSYTGQIAAVLGDTPTFGWKAAISNVDMAALTAFAGNSGVITGRLSGQVDVTGAGIDAAAAMKTARGNASITITNGVVKNLALVKSAVAATSRDPQAAIASGEGAHDEPFSELGATLSIFSGTASTPDLHLVAADLRLDAGGALRLDGSALNLKGVIQLSEELSRRASSAGVRSAGQDGRVALQATVRGVAGKYSIEID